MGAGGRRAGRGLKRAPVAAGEVGNREPRFLVPALGLFYAATFGAAAVAIDQLAAPVAGPWFTLLGAAVLLAVLVTVWLLLRTGWRRHREGLERRAAGWGVGALVAILLGVLVVYELVQAAGFNTEISGADVQRTQPVLQSLPRPPGATLIDEQAGVAGSETISDDFNIGNLATVIPFYAAALAKSGWTEDHPTADPLTAQFARGAYLVTVSVDQSTGPGHFAVTVDHLSPDLLGSPSGSASPSPSP